MTWLQRLALRILTRGKKGAYTEMAPGLLWVRTRDSWNMGDVMGDAPVCERCGHITMAYKGGYRCINCGLDALGPEIDEMGG